jgi:hypothetical protein
MDVLKNEFVVFNDGMFQGVETPCELIFCIIGYKKRDLEEVA